MVQRVNDVYCKKYNTDALARGHQRLLDHLVEVADLCRSQAPKRLETIAYCCGLLHDIGKYNVDFQRYLKARLEGVEPPCHPEHSIVGAILAGGDVPGGRKAVHAIQYVIAGHHSGLTNYSVGGASGKRSILERLTTPMAIKLLAASVPQKLVEDIRAVVAEIVMPKTVEFSMAVRLLSSALIDADRLSAGGFDDIEASIEDALELARENIKHYAHKPRENDPRQELLFGLRRRLLADAIGRSGDPRGVYTLCAPTGSGKTNAAMMWGLEHAVSHGLKRLIYITPQTTITSEIARAASTITHADHILEHHCNVVDDDPDQVAKISLARENWKGFPVVVTTSVQFIETLFTNRASRSRKLHRYADSVIVIDEVQSALPVRYLSPIARDLNELVTNHGCSILLSTATHPDLRGQEWRGFSGLEGNELNSDPIGAFEKVLRVKTEVLGEVDQPIDYEKLATALVAEPSILCVMNGVTQVHDLHALMPKGTYALTSRQCPEHRGAIIAAIKDRLHRGLPTRVISTSLIETGVNLDFPTVFRAITGLASVIQAAGRCNREWLLDNGRYVLFATRDRSNDPDFRAQKRFAIDMIRDNIDDLDRLFNPETFRKYSRRHLAASDLDRKKICADLSRGKPDFHDAGMKARVIEDETVSVIVPYGRGKTLIEELLAGAEIDWSEAQSRAVSIRTTIWDKLFKRRLVDECGLVRYARFYDEARGMG